MIDMITSCCQGDIWQLVEKVSYPIGWALAILALWRSRTPQGATAWVVFLLTLPIIAIPIFIFFGRTKFNGYTRGQRKVDEKISDTTEAIFKVVTFQQTAPKDLEPLNQLAKGNWQPGFMSSDEIQLLVDGRSTYDEMLNCLRNAEEYILFQFYIFKPDDIGQEFIQLLKEKAQSGVRVYFLVDKIGTSLKSKILKEMRAAGIQVAQFASSKSWQSQFQINFRNHRKVIVVDGHCAFVGGHNVGNEYLGKSSLGYWRDTHIKILGQSAMAAQVAFVKDWYWAAENLPALNWSRDLPSPQTEGDTIILHTGPADRGNMCLLGLLHLINTAKERIWIATPYFVPPEVISQALSLAVMRGVDVRIILPKNTDNRILEKASTVYIEALLSMGIKFHYFLSGFMHQKVMLVDHCGGVGSINMDNRSIFINFEIMAFSTQPQFVQDLKQALEYDFQRSAPITQDEFSKRPWLRKMMARVVNLFAPIL